MSDARAEAAQALAACVDRAHPPSEFEFARAVVLLARAAGLKLAAAESLTGGMLSELLTSVPGASNALAGSVVAYTQAAKVSVLGVSARTIADHSVVSDEVALEMAQRAAELFDAELAVACSGVAGPASQGGKPVGEVHIAVFDRRTGSSRVKSNRFDGTRDDIRVQTCLAAFGLLLDLLVPIAGIDLEVAPSEA